jgi:phosphonate transport system substrate-binding protein
MVLAGGIGGALLVAYMGRRGEKRTKAEDSKKVKAPQKRPYKLSFAQYMPRESARAAMEQIAAYLGKGLKRPIIVVVADEFDRVGAGLAAGDLDIAMLSPLLYVKAKRRYPGLRLISSIKSKGSTTYQGLILARVDRNINTLKELTGKTFCWVSRYSTSGYLFPMALFLSRKIDPAALFARSYFTGYHDEALRRLEAGVCDAAAVFSSTYFHAKVRGVIKTGIHVVAATEPIPRDAICAGRALTSDQIAEIRRVLLAYDPARHTDGKPLAGVFQISSFVTVKDSFYDPVRRVMDTVEAHHKGASSRTEKKKKKSRP